MFVNQLIICNIYTFSSDFSVQIYTFSSDFPNIFYTFSRDFWVKSYTFSRDFWAESYTFSRDFWVEFYTFSRDFWVLCAVGFKSQDADGSLAHLKSASASLSRHSLNFILLFSIFSALGRIVASL